MMPNVTLAMYFADFWLARLDSPDAPLMEAGAVGDFNAEVHRRLDFPDPLSLPDTLPAETIRARLYPDPPERPYYDLGGALLTPGWDAAAIPDPAPVRLGLVTRRASLRTYPTVYPAFAEPGQLYFDRFQETTLDTGWPVAVVHTVGAWAFALTPLYWGWLPLADIGFSDDRAALRAYQTPQDFMLVVGSQAGITLPDGRHVTAQMGARFPLLAAEGEIMRVQVPIRTADGLLDFAEGVVHARDRFWRRGYLPATLHSIFRQAFSLLGEPYAWGGVRQGVFGRDCSRFVRDVWATVGLYLPRNTDQQEQMGTTVARFADDQTRAARVAHLIDAAAPGALVFMPGHVMLYLGAVDGRPYMIHAFNTYVPPGGEPIVVNAVQVSDLPHEPGPGQTLTDSLSSVVQLHKG